MFELSCDSLAARGYTGKDYYRIKPNPTASTNYMTVVCDLDHDPPQTYVYPLPSSSSAGVWDYFITDSDLSVLTNFYDYCEQVR